MPSTFHKKNAIITLIGCMVLAVLFSAGVRLIHLEKGFKTYRSLFFLDDRTPMMTTMDAYYYLKLADERLSMDAHREGKGGEASTPLPSLMAAWLHGWTGASLETIAFYLPVFLSAFMTLLYFQWRLELGGPGPCLLAALIGSGNYYWYSRTCLGRFDTDALLPLFVFGITLLMYRFSVDKGWARRAAWLASSLIAAWLFQWWWAHARMLTPFLLATPYFMTLFFHPSGRVEKIVKYLLISVCLLAVIMVMFDLSHWAPGNTGPLFHRLSFFFKLIIGKGEGAPPGIGASIAELTPASLEDFHYRVPGGWLICAIALTGFALFTRKHYRTAASWAFPFFLGLGGILANRLLIFLVPFFALGVAYFFTWFIKRDFMKRLTTPRRRSAAAAAGLALFIVNVYSACVVTIRPPVTAHQAKLAKAIEKEAPAGAVIWCWWDHGHFLEFYGKRKAIINGGNQAPLRAMVAAFPLTVNDPTLAQNWMAFFAGRGMKGLYKVNAHFKNLPSTISFLKEALARPGDPDVIAQRFGAKNEKRWREFLFPRAPVYLHLPNDLLNKIHWWFYYGTLDPRTRQGERPGFTPLKAGRFNVQLDEGVARAEDRSWLLSHVYFYSSRPTPGAERREYPRETGYALIWAGEISRAYLFDRHLQRSLFVQLLFISPLSPPRGFRAVKYFPYQGGVWAVE